MAYQFRISQDEMNRLYENAQARMDAHLEFADEQKEIIAKHPYFKTEKEALKAALDMMNKGSLDYQIWAKIEKGEDGIFRVQNYWLLTDDGKTKVAAEYIGMALMYDDVRLNRIINDGVGINDVVAYW
jgi:hypothetical protein